MLARYGKDDPPSFVWIRIEEIKRFNMALFKLCRSFTASTCDGKHWVKPALGAPLDGCDSHRARHRVHARDVQFQLPTIRRCGRRRQGRMAIHSGA
ncbi:hypothetical protein BDW66DRAFT_139291 [Aspergillus desertorum]